MVESIQKLSCVTRVGLDLAKKVFKVHAVDANGEIVVVRKLARGRLVGFFSVTGTRTPLPGEVAEEVWTAPRTASGCQDGRCRNPI